LTTFRFSIIFINILIRINNPLLVAVSTSLGRDLERYLQKVAMAAVGRPEGVTHLEDADTLDRLRIVRALGMNNNQPELAVTGMASVLPSWIQSLGAAFLIWFQWWLGLIWLAAWPVLVYFMQREYLKVGQVGYGQSGALRRAEYLRDLAITAPAAKEVRIWGMLEWLLDRCDSVWLKAIEPPPWTLQPSTPCSSALLRLLGAAVKKERLHSWFPTAFQPSGWRI
jgi:ATP-binding cassette, subfamily B, bacterial